MDDKFNNTLKKITKFSQTNEEKDVIQVDLKEKRNTSTEDYVDSQNTQLQQQIIDFRDFLKSRSFRILYTELIFLAVLILLQGFKWWEFHINDWVIGIVSSGCLFQTFLIIRYIAVNIFPNNNNKSKGETNVHHHHHK